jgi:hypothetical protein
MIHLTVVSFLNTVIRILGNANAKTATKYQINDENTEGTNFRGNTIEWVDGLEESSN